MSYMIQQSTTAWELLFLMVQSSDHITALTGASPTVTLRKSGGSFASPAGAVSEIANGWYKVAGNATDTNTLGPLLLHATAASGDPTDTSFDVVAFNPQDAVHLGLSALPNAAAGASSGLPINGSNSGTMTLAALTITGSFIVTDGFLVSRTTNNSPGALFSGKGNGAGLQAVGGSGVPSVGISCSSGSSFGTGFSAVGNGSGTGINVQGGSTANGMSITGGGSFGNGLSITTTSGDGISITPTAGNAITATANGTSRHGVLITGGTAGTSDGIKVVAGTGGVDIRGNITGNLTGAVSGAVGSVTAAVVVDGTSPLTEVYPGKGSAFTLASALYGLSQRDDNMSINGTTLTVFKRDGTTVAQTFTLDSATAPTSIAQAT